VITSSVMHRVCSRSEGQHQKQIHAHMLMQDLHAFVAEMVEQGGGVSICTA
jgi:hypothetical protein